jgi:hypothetical protein
MSAWRPWRPAPTLCWTPVVTPVIEPVLAAWRYNVEVSRGDPNFSVIYDSIETEQACWTPTKGYADLTNYYWHVALKDGNNHLGSYSAPATFSKQYPAPIPLSPLQGTTPGQTPTFSWLPVDGAASYRLEVSIYENFGQLYDQVTTHNTQYTPTKLYDLHGRYWWRVAIIDREGNYGPFSVTMIKPYTVFLPLVERNY